MFRRTKTSHAAHIKRNTVGTSNELSFDVLDAAKNALDGSLSQPSTARPRPGVVGIESSKGWEVPHDEIKQRKARRQKHRLMTLVLTLVVLVAIGALGITALRTFLTHQGDTRSLLVEQLEVIEATDSDLVALDGLIIDLSTATLPVEPLPSQEEILQRTQAATQLLQQSEGTIQSLIPDLVIAEDKEAASQAISAIDARLVMLETTDDLAAILIPAAQNQQAFNQAWTTVIEADELAKEAMETGQAMTSETVGASKDQSERALERFIEARDAMQAIATSVYLPELDAYIAYVQLRIEAMSAAIAADQAYLDRDSQTLQEENDRYNTLDVQAVSAYSQLSPSTSTFILEQADQQAATLMERYQAERQRAGTADSFIREYLGKDDE